MVKEVSSAQNIDYDYVGKGQEITEDKKFKRFLAPNAKISNGFVIVFLIVILVTASRFPAGAFLSGDLEATVSIGYPFIFSILSISGNSTYFRFGLLLLDIVIWCLIAYIINVIFNALSGVKIFKKKSETSKSPTVFKDQNFSAPVKIAEKVAS